MDIQKTKDNSTLTLAVTGRLETTTAPELEEVIKTEFEGISELIFDLSGLEYISSAGLRVILSAQKKMNLQGSMKVTGVKDIVMEIFEITGFTDILTIE